MSKKLINTIFMVSVLLASLITSTYAWFLLDGDSYIDEFEFKYDSDDSFLVSVDGINFKEKIDNYDLVKAIVKEGYNLIYNNKGELIKDNKVLSKSDVYELFNVTKLNAVSSLDGVSFNSLYNEYEDIKLCYYSFELTFKMLRYTGNLNEIPIYFNEGDNVDRKCYINSNETKYYYHNNFNSFDESGNLVVNNSKDNGYVMFKASDAMRFSTTCDDVTKIYELNSGFGSYATDFDSSLDLALSKYDCSKNAAYTLFNSMSHNKIDPMRYSDMPKTYVDFSTNEAATLCVLSKENDYTSKVRFNYWLEGYDADCFNAIGDQVVDFGLSFTTNLNKKLDISSSDSEFIYDGLYKDIEVYSNKYSIKYDKLYYKDDVLLSELPKDVGEYKCVISYGGSDLYEEILKEYRVIIKEGDN